MRGRYNKWRRGRRRKKAAKTNQAAPLREFVYLDEVSVFSLISSRLGPVATEFTDSETSSLQSDVSSSLGGGIGLKGEIASRIHSGQTQGSQVLRKSTVQATFKDLFELERQSLAIGSLEGVNDNPQPDQRPLTEILADFQYRGYVVDSTVLERGRLIEVEVELEADRIYRVNAIVSAVRDMMQESPGIFPQEQLENLPTMTTMTHLLEKLMVGMVPVRGRAVDYDVVETDGIERLVHRSLLDRADDADVTRRPLYVVGVAEQSLFWKDIRRVLFSGSRFRVFCRLAQSGIQESWTSVKLTDVLKEAAPDLPLLVDVAGRGAMAAMGDSQVQDEDLNRRRCMERALLEYADALAEHHGSRLDTLQLTELSALARRGATSFETLEQRRSAFGELTETIDEFLGTTTDPLVAVQLRTTAMTECGMGLDGQLTSLAENGHPMGGTAARIPPVEERFLEAEFVAMYW